jgi:hypothetical protein
MLWSHIITFNKPKNFSDMTVLEFHRTLKQYIEDIEERIVWCVENFGKKDENSKWDISFDRDVSIIGLTYRENITGLDVPNTYFVFCSGSDAMLFKLTWGGQI